MVPAATSQSGIVCWPGVASKAVPPASELGTAIVVKTDCSMAAAAVHPVGTNVGTAEPAAAQYRGAGANAVRERREQLIGPIELAYQAVSEIDGGRTPRGGRRENGYRVGRAGACGWEAIER
jgi:hypothetical protein